jgi:hypothetical protein
MAIVIISPREKFRRREENDGLERLKDKRRIRPPRHFIPREEVSMSRTSAIILAIGCLVLSAAAFQAKSVDVTGDWDLTMAGGPGGPPDGAPPGGGGGERPAMVITFVQKGDVIEAKMQNPMGEEMKGTGKIAGNALEFTFTMTGGPMGDMSMVYKGKVDSDTMKGTIAMGDRGEMEWTAKRVKK